MRNEIQKMDNSIERKEKKISCAEFVLSLLYKFKCKITNRYSNFRLYYTEFAEAL
jgi:hypothetical protein